MARLKTNIIESWDENNKTNLYFVTLFPVFRSFADMRLMTS